MDSSEIASQLPGNFSETEVEKFVKMGKVLAGKAVLSYLMEVIKECGSVKVVMKDGREDVGAADRESAKLCKMIKKAIPFDYSGFTQCEFEEVPYKLNITLSIVDAGYKTDIAIPDSSYVNEILKQYQFLKEVATAYWNEFIKSNGSLFARAQKYCGGLDISKLHSSDENPTVLYFDPCTKKQIGIFAYYVDSDNRPLKRK
jgi:hypothetical protein|tara:strand:+ start:4353 stop:4955 length:603 start_codon:yes stop_codon:yes gene_type:complete